MCNCPLRDDVIPARQQLPYLETWCVENGRQPAVVNLNSASPIHQGLSFHQTPRPAPVGSLTAGNPENPLWWGVAEPCEADSHSCGVLSNQQQPLHQPLPSWRTELGPLAACCKTKSGMILQPNGPKIKGTAAEKRRPIGFWTQAVEGTSERISHTQPKVSPFRPLLGGTNPIGRALCRSALSRGAHQSPQPKISSAFSPTRAPDTEPSGDSS